MKFIVASALLVAGALAACNVPNQNWLGDGFCDFEGDYNTADCDFDKGDCCESTCVSTKEFECGARGKRQWAACKFAGNVCVIRPENEAATDNLLFGGVVIKGRGYIRASEFPCTVDDSVTFSECADCDYPFQAGQGNSWLNLSPWPQKLEKEGDEYKWIPYHSCYKQGCVRYRWKTNFVTTKTEVLCQEGTVKPCSCDDACTRYKDCCYDYQWACGSSIGFTKYSDDGNSADPNGELTQGDIQMGEAKSYWNTYPPQYNSQCQLP